MSKFKKKPRICFVSIDYPPHIIGGTGVYTQALAEFFSKKGYKVTVVTALEDSEKESRGKYGTKIKFVYSKSRNILSFWKFYFSFLKKNKEKFDVVHGNDLFHFPAIFLFKKKYKIISTIHNSYLQRFHSYSFSRRFYYPILILLEQILLMNSDKIVAVSNLSGKYLEKYYFIKNKINIIPNGVNANQFKKISSSLYKDKLKNKEKVILFVGRLVENKNPLFLCNLAKNFFPEDWKLTLVGDGPQREKVAEFTKSKNIILINKLDHKKMPEIYNSADLLILPSKSEGLSLTILEALACQLPVIITPEANYKNLVENGVDGFILKTTDKPEKWLESIKEALSKKSEYGENARKKIISMKLTLKDFEKKYKKLYLSLISQEDEE